MDTMLALVVDYIAPRYLIRPLVKVEEIVSKFGTRI